MKGQSGTNLETLSTGVVERGRRELAAEALTLERLVDFGVREDNAAVPAPVRGEPY